MYATEKSIIVTAPRGGYIPSGIVSYQLNIDRIYSCGYKSYVDKTSRDYCLYQEIPIRVRNMSDESDTIFLIDDIVDTSKTISNIRNMINKNNNEVKIYSASVFVKKASKRFVDFFVKEIPDETWVEFPYDGVTI
jgi:xanthine phosphoribosyltransferase